MAHSMITDLAESPDADVNQLLGRYRPHHGQAQSQSQSGQSQDGGKTAHVQQRQQAGQAFAKAALQALTGEGRGNGGSNAPAGACW